MKFNEYCWLNWVVGIAGIAFSIRIDNIFLTIPFGICLGYGICGTLVIYLQNYALTEKGNQK